MNLKEKLKDRYPTVKKLMDTFINNGYKIYIVGGAVRDMMLGDPIHDIDFTTDATPEQITELFENSLLLGAQFGSVQVPLDDELFDVTTFRKESDYKDNRHPGQLEFGTELYEDLERRDFTINSMALDLEGNLTDLFGGQEDLENGVIRTVGDPEERFSEDGLRKWRCIRFAAQKGFELERETHRSLNFDPDTSQISLERIRDELSAILLSEKVNWGGYLLVRTELYQMLLKRLLPQILSRIDEQQDLIEAFEVMHYMPKKLSLRLAALLLFFEEEEALTFLKSLRYPNKTIKEVISFLRSFPVTLEDGIVNYKKAVSELGRDHILDLIDFQYASAFVDQNKERLKHIEETREYAQKILTENHPLVRNELAIDGNDLAKLGYNGNEMRRIFDTLLEAVYLDPQANTRENLIALAQDKGEPL